MLDSKITLDLHEDHKLWDGELSLYLVATKAFEMKLSQLQNEFKTFEESQSLESFQNQLFVNKNAIIRLKNDIQKHEKVLANKAKDKLRNINYADKDFHNTIYDKLEVQKKIFRDLRNSFYQFINDYTRSNI